MEDVVEAGIEQLGNNLIIGFEPPPPNKGENDKLDLLEAIVDANNTAVIIPSSDKQTTYYIAGRLKDTQKLAGFVELQERDKGEFEAYSAVHPNYQKRQIMAHLLTYAVSSAVEGKIPMKTMVLSVDPSSPFGKHWEKIDRAVGPKLAVQKVSSGDRLVYKIPINQNLLSNLKQWYRI